MPILIAFDLDGTLIDSKRDLADSANEMLQSYGAAPLAENDVAGMVGDGAGQLVARALDAAALKENVSEALDRFLTIYSSRLFNNTRPYAGLPQAVASASSQAFLAVLTNKPEALTHQLLAGFGMSPYFSAVIGGDSGFPRKPDPAGLRHLIQLAGANPETTLMVGDSMMDVETARGAGTAVCIVQYGFGHLRRPILRNGTELIAQGPENVGRLIDSFVSGLRQKAPGDGAARQT